MADGTTETMFDLVRTLTELPGPTGHEDAVQDWLRERWAGDGAEVRRTRVGNMLAKVGGSGPRLLLLGHADELCLLVKSISDDGFLHVAPYYADTLGHPSRAYLPLSQPALVLTGDGTIPGYFAAASGHVLGRNNPDKRFEWNDLFLEIAAGSRQEAEDRGIHPGCRAIWNPPTRRLGQHLFVGKAMDDRAALALMTLAAARLAGRDDLAYELWLASTVQEENGLIGASSLADELDFDLCLTIDVGLTGDIPGPDKRDFPAKLGGGPTIVYKDNACHYSRRLSDRLVARARRNGIPVQQAVFQNYASDGGQLLRRGVETASSPTRRATRTPRS